MTAVQASSAHANNSAPEPVAHQFGRTSRAAQKRSGREVHADRAGILILLLSRLQQQLAMSKAMSNHLDGLLLQARSMESLILAALNRLDSGHRRKKPRPSGVDDAAGAGSQRIPTVEPTALREAPTATSTVIANLRSAATQRARTQSAAPLLLLPSANPTASALCVRVSGGSSSASRTEPLAALPSVRPQTAPAATAVAMLSGCTCASQLASSSQTTLSAPAPAAPPLPPVSLLQLQSKPWGLSSTPASLLPPAGMAAAEPQKPAAVSRCTRDSGSIDGGSGAFTRSSSFSGLCASATTTAAVAAAAATVTAAGAVIAASPSRTSPVLPPEFTSGPLTGAQACDEAAAPPLNVCMSLISGLRQVQSLDLGEVGAAVTTPAATVPIAAAAVGRTAAHTGLTAGASSCWADVNEVTSASVLAGVGMGASRGPISDRRLTGQRQALGTPHRLLPPPPQNHALPGSRRLLCCPLLKHASGLGYDDPLSWAAEAGAEAGSSAAIAGAEEPHASVPSSDVRCTSHSYILGVDIGRYGSSRASTQPPGSAMAMAVAVAERAAVDCLTAGAEPESSGGGDGGSDGGDGREIWVAAQFGLTSRSGSSASSAISSMNSVAEAVVATVGSTAPYLLCKR